MSDGEEAKRSSPLWPTEPIDDFAWLGIAPQFPIDIALLDRAYRDRQADCHPDRFLLDDEQTREAATLRASRINDAYRRLRDPQTAAEALYRLRFGERELEEAKADPIFLSHVLDWREAAEVASAASDLGRLNGLSDEIRKALAACFNSVIEGFDVNNSGKIVTAIVHWKYLRKTLDDLADKIDRVIGG